jgi:flagellar hook-length control protein FliK
MQDLSQLKLMLIPSGDDLPGRTRTPGEIGKSLFQDLMVRHTEREWGEIQKLSYWRLVREKGSATDEGARCCQEPLKKLQEKMQELRPAVGQILLPSSAIPQLAHFLESQGLAQEEIHQLISSTTDRHGFIDISRLLTRILCQKLGTRAGRQGLIIHRSSVPQVEEILFRMNLGVGRVREVIEKSMNSNGELPLDRLASTLSGALPGFISEEGLSAMLAHFKISGKPEILSQAVTDQDLRKQLEKIAETHSQDTQKSLKHHIATLLREKGVPPQKVKSFLETLSVDQARFLLGKGRYAPEACNDLLNRAAVRSRPEWHKGGWQEKILDILRKESPMGGEELLGKNLQEDGEVRLSLTELLKTGDQETGLPFRQGMGPPFDKGLAAMNSHRQAGGLRPKQNDQSRGNTAQAKGLIGGEPVPLRMRESDSWPAPQTAHSRPLPQPLPNILDRMIWMIQAGAHRSRIFISPPELGTLDLDLVVKGRHLQANLSAESPAVKELIEANLGQLRQQLTDQGFVIERFEVSVGLDERRAAGWEAGTRKNRNRRSRTESAGKAESLTVQKEPRLASLRGLHRIHVQV